MSEPISLESARAVYLARREALESARARADAAFSRYFAKRQSGAPTSGAAWQRLENEANYLSADLFSAESVLYDANLDPEKVWEERNNV